MLGPASARTSKYGGTLVVGLASSDVGILDPTLASSTKAVQIDLAMCQQLYDYVENHGRYEWFPVLAAAPPAISADRRRYTVRLKQGIEFNDGTPFNAQAVVASVQRFMTYPGSQRQSDFAAVDSVSASGPYTVVFHMKQRDSAFTGNGYVLSPSALASEGANFPENPVCVGPFMYDHRVAGDSVTLVKSPYYYKRSAIHLDAIVYKWLPDAAAAAAALQAGDLHALDSVSPTVLPAVQQSASLRVLQTPQLGWQGVFVNIGNRSGVGNLPYASVGTPLAQSPKLRQAFEEAIDRNTLNRVVFAGLYQPSCTAIAPANTVWYAATKVPCTRYDPADARKLVASSGVSNPTVHLLIRPTTDDSRLAQFIQAQEAAVGIDVVIDTVDNATFAARRQNGNFDAATGGRFPGTPEPQNMIYRFVATAGETNYSGYSNPRMDYVLANGLKASQLGARAVNYRVAQQIIHDDRPLIVLYNATTIAAFTTSLTGIGLTYNGFLTVTNARFK